MKFGIIKEKNQFRVWSKKEKKMYYGIYNLEPFIDNDNYVIMQCCGFRDMNKTLAYEGDVVMPYDDFYCILEYGFGEFTLSLISYEKCQEIRKKGFNLESSTMDGVEKGNYWKYFRKSF